MRTLLHTEANTQFADWRDCRSCLGFETKGIETLRLVSVLAQSPLGLAWSYLVLVSVSSQSRLSLFSVSIIDKSQSRTRLFVYLSLSHGSV